MVIVPLPAAVDELVTQCLHASGDHDAPGAIADVVERFVRRPALIAAISELDDAAFWHQSGSLTIVAMPIAPGFRFWPHDHQMWAVTGMAIGSEHNTLFELIDGVPLARAQLDVAEGHAVRHDPDVIHTAANPENRVSFSVHVFGGDPAATPTSEWDPEGWQVRRADGETPGRRRAAMAAYLAGREVG